MEVIDIEQAEVSRDAVAALEEDDIAGDELGGGDAEAAAVAADGGLSEDHSIEGIDGFFGFGLLDKTDDGVDEYDAEDDA